MRAGRVRQRLQQIALQQALRKPTDNLDAYDMLLRARALSADPTRNANRMAREMLERVTQMAPGYADAYAEAAMRLNVSIGPEASLDLGLAYLPARRYADAVRLLEAQRTRRRAGQAKESAFRHRKLRLALPRPGIATPRRGMPAQGGSELGCPSCSSPPRSSAH